MAKELLRIRLEETAGKHFEELAMPQKKAYFDALTSSAGEALMRAAMRRMSGYLKPGHKFNVGASGKSSENFEVVKGKLSTGRVIVSVMEGNKPKSNFFIRRGFKGTKSTRRIPRQKILEWAANKGVDLYYKEQTEDGTAKYTYSRLAWWNKKKKPYIRSVKNKSTAEWGIFKIIEKLEQRGSSGGRWEKLYPEGQPRFDYVQFLAYKDSWWKEQIDQHASKTTNAYLNYLSSGKRGTAGFRNFTRFKTTGSPGA